MPQPPAPFTVSLAVSRQQTPELIASPDLAARLDQLGLAFLVFGLERFSGDGSPGGRPPGPGPDPATVISYAAPRFARTGLVSAYAPHRDHPYNIARRVASADHIAAGRAGAILGFRDQALTGGDAWGGDGLQEPLPLTAASVADAAAAIQELWQSFPAKSIIADRGTGQFIDATRIRRIDHQGSYRIDGALSVPTTPQGTPVLLGYVSSGDELELLRGHLDLAVLSAGADPAVLRTGPGEPGVIREVTVDLKGDPAGGGTGELPARLAQAREAGAAGVLITPGGNATIGQLADILRSQAGRLGLVTGHAGLAGPRGQTLREILGLPQRRYLLGDARQAFPAVDAAPAAAR
ncbi:MAG TPA: LLM class flavin-dependent oxidoreductase [Trebonia sp.]|jgi:alkanesulfonate monooxygenase SsuD/methylene tetrahydromethanopterin reductase-like flavin-dependent oxidoreductase (luciferase family)